MKSIIQTEKECYFCGDTRLTEEHHIFGGPNRKHSEKYGLKVNLCPYCHRHPKEGVHADAIKADHLHQIGQQAFEKTHTRAEFMKIFGKNYVDTPEEKKAPKPKGWGFTWIN